VKKGEYLLKRLNELKEKHFLIGDVRGKGLMVGIELVKDRKTKEPAVEETSKLKEAMREKRSTYWYGGVKACTIRFQPPLIITNDELDKALTTFDQELSNIERCIT